MPHGRNGVSDMLIRNVQLWKRRPDRSRARLISREGAIAEVHWLFAIMAATVIAAAACAAAIE